MKKLMLIACACAVTLASSYSFAAADSHADMVSRLNAASSVISEIQSIPAKAIPNWLVSKATCVAVVPSYKKAAFIVGATYGQGVVTCRTAHGWSAPAFIQLTGGSFGFQAGGQATDLVLVATNQGGMQSLLKSKFKIGGDAAASAGPVGRNAAADTNLFMKSELLTYSRSRGIFAGIDLNGTVVHQNGDDTRAFYGHEVPFESILEGKVATPRDARPFVGMIAKYFRKVK